jgi:hypothetical protein
MGNMAKLVEMGFLGRTSVRKTCRNFTLATDNHDVFSAKDANTALSAPTMNSDSQYRFRWL